MISVVFLMFARQGVTGMTSAHYTVTSSVVSGGGGTASTASGVRAGTTLGQTISSDPVSSENYDLYAGFWYTLPAGSLLIWDLEPETGDGDVDGLDLFQFINLEGTLDIESFGFEFGLTNGLE